MGIQSVAAPQNLNGEPSPRQETLSALEQVLEADPTFDTEVDGDEDPQADPEIEPPGDPDDSEASPEADETEAGAEPAERDGISTLADLAEAFETDIDVLTQHLEVEVGDGQRATLKQVIESYDSRDVEDRVAEGLTVHREQLQQEAAQYKGQHAAKMNELTAQVERMIALQNVDASSVNLQELQRDDPDEYLRRRVQLDDRERQIESALNTIRGERSRYESEAQQEAQQRHMAEATKFRSAMRRTWKTNEDLAKGIKGITDYLGKSYGFEPAEIDAVEDHRYLLIAWKAQQYDKALGQVALSRKRVKNLKKTLPAGARRERQKAGTAKLDQAARGLAKTGDARYAAPLIENLMED